MTIATVTNVNVSTEAMVLWKLMFPRIQPLTVKERQKEIFNIDQKIIFMYTKGMNTRKISKTIEDIYGFEASEGFISNVTDKVLAQIKD